MMNSIILNIEYLYDFSKRFSLAFLPISKEEKSLEDFINWIGRGDG